MSKFTFNLQLFSEGVATPGESAIAEGTHVGSGNQQKEQVIYGKQQDTTESVVEEMVHAGDKEPTEPKQMTPEERKAEFESLIKGEYKDLFGERIQQIIDKRFKETKSLEARTKEQGSVLEMIAQRYGVDATDIQGIQKALDNDHAYWETAADEAGLTVEQYKQIKMMERENQALKEMQQRFEREQFFNQQQAKWLQESQAIQSIYPTFDFEAELQNPKFQSLLRSGVPMQNAYEVLHMDDIKTNLMQTTAQTVESKVADNIRAKGQRPSENGLSHHSGVVVKNDVSKLSRADRAEIAKRVARGENISY